MSVWPVFIDHWQQQSGGRPFAIGDEVEWTVVLIDGRERSWPDELLVDARVELQEHPSGLPMPGSVAVSGGVHAWWQGSQPPGSVLELRGALLEDHHSLGSVYTRGTVRRIQVLTQRYEPRADGVLLATWDGWQARDVNFSRQPLTATCNYRLRAAAAGGTPASSRAPRPGCSWRSSPTSQRTANHPASFSRAPAAKLRRAPSQPSRSALVQRD